jgi:hypothetical protein
LNFQEAADGRQGWNGRDQALAGGEPGRDARGSATASAPSPNGGNGRDARGRWAPGNQGGPDHGPRPDGPGANGRPKGDTTGHNTTAPPSAKGGNGRDERGRFARGNPGGPGNPFARQAAALRQAVYAVVKPEVVQQLMEMLVQRALGGDLAALKLLLLYAVGRPTEAVNPDTLDQEEWRLLQENRVDGLALVQGLQQGMPLTLARDLLRALVPAMDAALRPELTRKLVETQPVEPTEDMATEEVARSEEDTAAAPSRGGTPAPPPENPGAGPMDHFLRLMRESLQLCQHLENAGPMGERAPALPDAAPVTGIGSLLVENAAETP